MYNNKYLSASLMCIDWLNAGKDLVELENNNIDFLHYDIVDGNFAPDFTMGSSIIDVFKNNSKLSSDYHLMVEEPSRLFETFHLTKNDFFTIHQESSRNLHRNLVKIKQVGAKVGVALSPATPLTTLDYIIEELDLVLVMTVNPGYKGQPIVPQVFRKIYELKNIISKMNLKTLISVDGNVNSNTIPDIISAGADILVLGSSGLFRKEISISESIDIIKNSIDLGMKR